MVSNVWEWCHSLFKPYPYKADDGRENESGLERRVLRGGAWGDRWHEARAVCRTEYNPDRRDDSFGFRVVVAPKLSKLSLIPGPSP